MTAAEVFDHPDPRARELLDAALDALAVQVANMAIALDPARIAVGRRADEQAGRDPRSARAAAERGRTVPA